MREGIHRDRTKYGLNEALKELMRKKPLDQIRIRELTDLCGLRRQDRFLTWQQALKDLMRHAEEDRAYYLALRESRGRQGLWQVFGGALEELLRKTMAYYQKRSGGTPTEEETALRLRCGTVVMLALLEGGICGDLQQPTEEVGGLLEASMRREALGAVWQNLPQWQRG